MPSFTIPAENRDARSVKLTLAEASEMATLGFRFGCFREEAGEFRLSRPYTVAENRDRLTLTFMQD